MRISDWSSDVCSSDLTSSEQARYPARQGRIWQAFLNFRPWARSRLHSRMAKHVNLSTMATRSHSSVGVSAVVSCQSDLALAWDASRPPSSASVRNRSEEHTSELQSLLRNSYAVFCF